MDVNAPADPTSTTVADDPMRLSQRGQLVELIGSDGDAIHFSTVWLRDMCSCPECVHPSGQRLIDPAGFTDELVVVEARVEAGVATVRWGPDGHTSQYVLAELEAVAPPHTGGARQPWAAELAGHIPAARHGAIAGDDSELHRWLSGVEHRGVGVLHGVPIADGEVARVAELFGHVRVTNYGRYFDVRTQIDPANLANTSLALGPHTDNPYRDPVPTMQLLHCLSSSATGGENVVVDGFRVAEQIRADDPAGFAALADCDVTFTYSDAHTHLAATRPILELDRTGQVRAVCFNSRSMLPPVMATDTQALWYSAYRHFARLLADPGFQARIVLTPGDLFIVDNRRVLHGRTGYSAGDGNRHLQGCYADIDGLRSKIAVLARTL
ncbi:MAG: putative gamma-butyrobetaine dioxygenase [Acidimicrobiaceae bacterium]|nr:MAG: putative gamma-butyrobetaine dioxygenase [Acidimicrobiaceae bacterium]